MSDINGILTKKPRLEPQNSGSKSDNTAVALPAREVNPSGQVPRLFTSDHVLGTAVSSENLVTCFRNEKKDTSPFAGRRTKVTLTISKTGKLTPAKGWQEEGH